MRILIIQGNFGENLAVAIWGDCYIAAFGWFVIAKILIRLVAFIRLIFNGLQCAIDSSERDYCGSVINGDIIRLAHIHAVFVAKIVCERGLESLMLHRHGLDIQCKAFALIRAKLFERFRILQCASEIKIHHAAAFRHYPP